MQKALHLGRGIIYRSKLNQPDFEDFILPFNGKLRSNNRWVILSKIIPWDEIERDFISGNNELLFEFHNLQTPKQLGVSNDDRKLGLGFYELEILEN